MFGVFFPPRNHNLHRMMARWRVLLGLWTLAVIGYFGVEYAFGAPYNTLIIKWQANGVAVVTQDSEPASTTDMPGFDRAQRDDILLAIDGLPFRNMDTQFRFGPIAEDHTYTLQRGEATFTLRLPSGRPNFKEFIALILPILVALEAWALGFLILLFAPQEDYAAWLTGLVTLGFAVALAASSAVALGIPGSRLAFGVLVPIVSVGYLEMAFLPGASAPHAKGKVEAFSVLYGVAVLVSALAVVEILFLNPASSWEAWVGVRLSLVLIMILALALVASPIIMALRLNRLPSAYARRQITILLVGTGLATLPLILLTIVPELVGARGLPWEITLPLLGLIPAAYGYVIYRHRYLNLDFFVSRSAIVLVAVLAISALYTVGVGLIESLPGVSLLGPLAGVIVLILCFGMMGRVSARLQNAVNLLLYGPNRHLDDALRELTAKLSADPEIQTLKTVLLGRVPELLQVRQAALLLADKNGWLTPVETLRVEAPLPFRSNDISQATSVYLREASPALPSFDQCVWARIVAPLHTQNRIVGALLLGPKAPDGNFDAQEVAFVQHIAAAAAIAAESARLFEALRDMSQDLMRVRAAERMQLSSRLHNEPLQRAAGVAYGLGHLLASLPRESEAAVVIARQKDEVQRLTREIRDICAGLRPRILDEGLTLTLQNVLNSFQANNPDVQVIFQSHIGEEPTLTNEALDAIYHILTESLTNVAKHSGAARVAVVCQPTMGALTLTIADNGRGTPLAGLSLPELVRDHHFGLVGMHQSAKIAQGQLDISPAQPRGTVITLTLPLTGVVKVN